MTSLPKHLQPRWRYLAIEIETWPDATIDRRGFQRALWYAAGNLLGDPGSADADLTLLRFSFERGEGAAIVRVRRGKVGPARAALACIDTIDGEPTRVRVRRVSGTVEGCKKQFSSRASVKRDDAVDVKRDGTWVGATTADGDFD